MVALELLQRLALPWLEISSLLQRKAQFKPFVAFVDSRKHIK